MQSVYLLVTQHIDGRKERTHNNNWRKIKDVDDVEKKRTCEREREIMVTGNKNNVSSDDKWQEQKRKKERERERVGLIEKNVLI